MSCMQAVQVTACLILSIFGFDDSELPITPLEEPAGHGRFYALAFSPDGLSVAGGTELNSMTSGRPDGGEVLIWNAQTGKLVRSLGKHGDSVNFVKFSKDGATLVTSSINGIIRAWSTPGGTQLTQITLKDRLVYNIGTTPSVFVSPSGDRIFAAVAKPLTRDGVEYLDDTYLKCWNTETGKEEWSIETPEVWAAAVSPTYDKLLICTESPVPPTRRPTSNGDQEERRKFLTLIELKTGRLYHGQASIEAVNPLSVIFLNKPDHICIGDRNGLTVMNLKSQHVLSKYLWEDSRDVHLDIIASADRSKLVRVGLGYVDVFNMSADQPTRSQTCKFPIAAYNTVLDSKLSRLACLPFGYSSPVIIDLHRTATSK